MRTLCGRLKSDYRYAKDIVYNNFPWPKPTKELEEKIAKLEEQLKQQQEDEEYLEWLKEKEKRRKKKDFEM